MAGITSLFILLLFSLLSILLLLRILWKKRRGGRVRQVVFVHPDLGVGGAERLVVDAALELRKRGGYLVTIYTAFHSPERCFPETLEGTFQVRVFGNWFPRHFGGKGHALCAYVRTAIAAIAALILEAGKAGGGVFFVDQVAAVVPLLRLCGARVAFYCHFPDMLLAKPRSRLHALYRLPIDMLEEAATGAACTIMVNSRFTASVYAQTFRRLAASQPPPLVVYPAVDVESIAFAEATSKRDGEVLKSLPDPASIFNRDAPLFVSFNRFERKKMVEIAISALARLQGAGSQACLVVAGGYDSRLDENKEYLEELRLLVKEKDVESRVAFLPNFSNEQREILLRQCTALLYTPPNEHFGIVPLEAMAAGRPVVACNSGGPLESIEAGKTGMLCSPTAPAFAAAMQVYAEMSLVARQEQGKTARLRVEERFSRQRLGEQIGNILNSL